MSSVFQSPSADENKALPELFQGPALRTEHASFAPVLTLFSAPNNFVRDLRITGYEFRLA